MCYNIAHFRFYEELNDFLPQDKKKKAFSYQFEGKPSIKDAIEAIGIPHTEVDLILANGKSVGFDYHLGPGDRISVYPVFESLDISPIVQLREKPLRNPAFVLDVHLGKLARLLRMLGFDTLYRNDYTDNEIIKISINEKRIILTRDRGVLKHNSVTHGYCVRSTKPIEQTREVLHRFDIYSQVKPFCRCIQCNGVIDEIAKESIIDQLPARTATFFNKFYACLDCGKIYWKGSHYKGMKEKLDNIFLAN